MSCVDFLCIVVFLSLVSLVILFVSAIILVITHHRQKKTQLPKKTQPQKKSEETFTSVKKYTRLDVTPIKNVDEYHKKVFDVSERVKYYLGNVVSPMYITLYDTPIKTKNTYIITSHFFDTDVATENSTIKNYIDEMKVYYNEFKKRYITNDKKFILVAGDVTHTRDDIAFISKTRPVIMPNSNSSKKGKTVILPLNNIRHWKPVSEVKMYDIPYDSKSDTVIWRGASTGKDSRNEFVENYYNYPSRNIDVGFTSFMEYYKGPKNPDYIKKSLTMEELLTNKFLVSIEGNDVASNLKWVLASNSLCLMPVPKIESWLMEGLLVPWTHYVPFDIESKQSLEEVYEWCVANPDKCKKIIDNANSFMSNFMNGDTEFKIIAEVMKGYADKITIF